MLQNYGKFSVRVIPMLETNYAYLLHEHTHNLLALIDPAEPEKILPHCHVVPRLILSTHHHEDHVAGNLAIISQYQSIECLAMDDRVPGVTRLLKDRESIAFGDLTIEAIHTPCHTRGSACFVIRDPDNIKCAFTGDTLFLGGCGYFFEGDAAQMHYSLNQCLAKLLPADCHLWVGHEYLRDNLKFALEVEPDNQAIKERLRSIEGRQICLPGTMSEELATNVFMRLKGSDPVAAMHQLREAKNAFNKRAK